MRRVGVLEETNSDSMSNGWIAPRPFSERGAFIFSTRCKTGSLAFGEQKREMRAGNCKLVTLFFLLLYCF